MRLSKNMRNLARRYAIRAMGIESQDPAYVTPSSIGSRYTDGNGCILDTYPPSGGMVSRNAARSQPWLLHNKEL